MRTKYSILNSITSTICNVVMILLGFISQSVFIKLLGTEYLGLNGLFTNILTVLSFFELGVGNAIVFHLYKPIRDNDTDKIKSLMYFYKKAYTIISIVVLCVGILIMPFIKMIVGEVTIDVNIYIIYIMFLLNTSSSYILSYKKNLIVANQRSYIINIIHIIYLICLNFGQLIILYITKNYYIYLMIKFILQIIENIVCSYFAKKLYPYINVDKKIELESKVKKDIYDKVKALLYHKVGNTIVNGTDNIIISMFFGISTVGIYTNYYMIINSVNTLFNQVITSITASIGNLLVSENDPNKKFQIFKKIRFFNFWISSFSAICILLIINPFITVWLGKQYLLSNVVVIVLTFNFFQKLQRSVYITFKDSAGIWEEDKIVPVVESILNIVFSIFLLKIFGLAGVFLGTIVSGIALWGYSYPRFVYKKIFNRTYKNYIKETLGYITLFLCLSAITYSISMIINFNNNIYQLIYKCIIGLSVPNILMILIFRNSENYKYFKNLIIKLVNKTKKA